MKLIILNKFDNLNLLINVSTYYCNNYKIDSIRFACIDVPEVCSKLETEISSFLRSEDAENEVYLKLKNCKEKIYSSPSEEEFFSMIKKEEAERDNIVFDLSSLDKITLIKYVAKLLAMEFRSILTIRTSENFRGLYHEAPENMFSIESLYDNGFEFVRFMRKLEAKRHKTGLWLSVLMGCILVILNIYSKGALLDTFNFKEATEAFLAIVSAIGGFLAISLSVTIFFNK